jgi:hypothetical protein
LPSCRLPKPMQKQSTRRHGRDPGDRQAWKT